MVFPYFNMNWPQVATTHYESSSTSLSTPIPLGGPRAPALGALHMNLQCSSNMYMVLHIKKATLSLFYHQAVIAIIIYSCDRNSANTIL